LHAWIVVFILPVNSAVNPLLYTFTTPKFRERFNESWFGKVHRYILKKKPSQGLCFEMSNYFNSLLIKHLLLLLQIRRHQLIPIKSRLSIETNMMTTEGEHRLCLTLILMKNLEPKSRVELIIFIY